MSGPEQRIVLAPGDGSLGPLLRVADDRLDANAGYGRHEHRAVDVVAVVLAGAVRHRWAGEAEVRAGDVAVLRAGAGLEHDEVAGPEGARVLQCYLRSAEPGAAPRHEVRRAASGWVDLRRPDVRLWVAPPGSGEASHPPPGLMVVVGPEEVTVEPDPVPSKQNSVAVLVWQLDLDRPPWAKE